MSTGTDAAKLGVNPYSTGGGGVALEHRYGAVLLAHLLSGDPITELGDHVAPVRVRFQAGPFSAVDDLVVFGRSVEDVEVRAAIGVRRNPKLVPSDKSSVELISAFLRALFADPQDIDDGTLRLVLAVAVPSPAVLQLEQLVGIASAQESESAFREQVAEPGMVQHTVRGRLKHIDAVVVKAMPSAGGDPLGRSASDSTWRLLKDLKIRLLRLEGSDLADRTSAVARLRGVVPDGTPAEADRLFAALAEQVSRYAPAGATRSASTLRRDLAAFALRPTMATDTPSGAARSSAARFELPPYALELLPTVGPDRDLVDRLCAAFTDEDNDPMTVAREWATVQPDAVARLDARGLLVIAEVLSAYQQPRAALAQIERALSLGAAPRARWLVRAGLAALQADGGAPQADEFFRQALEFDPQYALAAASIAVQERRWDDVRASLDGWAAGSEMERTPPRDCPLQRSLSATAPTRLSPS